MAEQRFVDRKRRARRRLWRRVLGGAGAVLLIGLVVWAVAFSDLLAVHKVKVSGLDSMERGEVVETARVPMGTPLVRLDVDAIAERLRELARVESVDVSRAWPRAVSIRITERTAVGWLDVDGEIHGIDRHGVDFRTYDELPDVTEMRVTTADERRHRQSLEGLATVLGIMRQQDPGLLAQIEHAAADSQDSLTFVLTGDRTVRWGNHERSEDKLAVLTALLSSVEAREYDVSAPEQPTTAQ